MGVIDTEIWKLTSKCWKISTDKKRLRNRLEKIIGSQPGDVYLTKKGQEVGWAFTFKAAQLNEIRKEVRSYEKETKKLANARSKNANKKN